MPKTSLINFIEIGKIIFFLLLLILCNKIKISLDPVPFTLGTFAVLLIGYFNKPATALMICILYLIAGLVGLPVFSNNNSLNFHLFLEMKSSGYILGFIPAAYFISIFSYRLKNVSLFRLCLLGIIGHIIIVAVGCFWLCRFIPSTAAFWNGVYPFIPGAIIKTVLAAFLTWSVDKAKGYYARR